MKIVTFIVIACFIFIILFINILIMKGDLPMGAPMKNSRQRNAILECVMRHHDHPTADIIYQELRESFPNISLGTVYRNLSLLTSLGKIMFQAYPFSPSSFALVHLVPQIYCDNYMTFIFVCQVVFPFLNQFIFFCFSVR